MTTPISAAKIEQYKARGYTTVDGFFVPREVQAMQREVGRWVDQGLPRDVAIPDSRQNLQLIPLFPQSRLFRALPFHPRVTGAVSALLGDPVVKILDQMFYKPPRVGMGTNWHTDNAYFHIPRPVRGCAMWIAIHDANRGNGTLKVMPDMVERQLLHERDPASDHHIRTWLDETHAVHCELAAGGVTFFSFGTPHATGANPTDAGRAGVGIHFVNFDHAAEDMKRGKRWQHARLTGPDATRGEREYGERVSFSEEVDKVLAGA